MITGFPKMRCELEFEDEHGDHAVGGVVLTATRIVNAIPAVCDAPRRACSRRSICRWSPAAACTGRRRPETTDYTDSRMST